MPKPRSDSVLDGMPENQRAAIERWLFEENLSHKETAGRIFQDFNVRISPSAVACFYQRCAQRRMLQQIAASSATSSAIVDQFRRNPDCSFEALLGMIGQAAFEMKMKGGAEMKLSTLKDLAEIMAMGLKVKTETKKIQQKDEQIRLAWEKYMDLASERFLDRALRDAAEKIANNTNLTRAQQIAAMRKAAFSDVDELEKSGAVKIPKPN